MSLLSFSFFFLGGSCIRREERERKIGKKVGFFVSVSVIREKDHHSSFLSIIMFWGGMNIEEMGELLY